MYAYSVGEISKHTSWKFENVATTFYKQIIKTLFSLIRPSCKQDRDFHFFFTLVNILVGKVTIKQQQQQRLLSKTY